MALNRERLHLLVLPEDDATRSIANGFVDVATGPMQVLNPARGWPNVLHQFETDQISQLRKYRHQHLVLLIDFDDQYPARLGQFQNAMPGDVQDRVYVLGALTEAETLKRESGKKFGPLGQALAQACAADDDGLWSIGQLMHNKDEIQRLKTNVKPFLFPVP